MVFAQVARVDMRGGTDAHCFASRRDYLMLLKARMKDFITPTVAGAAAMRF